MTARLTVDEVASVLAQADCLYDSQAVNDALVRMAEAISRRLAQANPVVLVVMKGGIVPGGCLLPRLDFPLEVDYLHATRYRDQTRGGLLDWRVRPGTSLQGRVVLVVDDILDEGVTLTEIVAECRRAGAAEVLCAVLVEKDHARKPGLRHAEFTGLVVPDRYVFGFGMDYRGYLRNAPGIYAVRGL